MREFASVTGKQLPVKMVGSRQGLRQAEVAITDQNNQLSKLTYPFALMVVADISTDAEKAGFKKNRATNGIMIGRDVNTGTAYFEDLRPVKVGLGINFRTDSLEEVIKLAHVLLMNVPKVAFTMKGSHDFQVETSITIDPSVSIPETNFETPGEAFSYEFVIILNTYIGYAHEMRLIKELRFNMKDADGEEFEFYSGPAYKDMTKVIKFTDFYDENNSLFKGLD